MARSRRRRLRRGGAPIRKMAHGGMHNGCPPGQYMSDGQCVSSGGYSRGGNIRRMKTGGRARPAKKMQTGGQVFCPDGNYGYDEYGHTICI